MAELFEFRIFDKDLSLIERKIKKIASLKKYKEDEDTYIISRNNDNNNIKIRNKDIKVKSLVKEVMGLELWERKFWFPFPVKTSILMEVIFPALQVEIPEFKLDKYNYDEFIKELIIKNKELKLIEVHKKRNRYLYKNCEIDMAFLLIKGIPVQSVSLEDFEIDHVLEVIKILELDEYENTNYVRGIKKLIWP